MARANPLTAMSERRWEQVWTEQQRALASLPSMRGLWLPNVVEPRPWGAVRWTSGRPDYAGSTGQAIAEKFAVTRPDADPGLRNRIVANLTDPSPVTRLLGYPVHEHQIGAMTIGAVCGGLLTATLAALVGGGWVAVLVAATVGALVGMVAGAALATYRNARARSAVLGDTSSVRVVTGRFAPPSWLRLVGASTLVEERASGGYPGVEEQAHEAIHAALWEAAALVLRSSDHTGVEVLADGVERLANAHRR
ncbi:MAG: hypothetical protein ICV70_03365 [Jiangellaceae bacterium]|nr:hypothetical protein [Jiangellaceae bacterium]